MAVGTCIPPGLKRCLKPLRDSNPVAAAGASGPRGGIARFLDSTLPRGWFRCFSTCSIATPYSHSKPTGTTHLCPRSRLRAVGTAGQAHARVPQEAHARLADAPRPLRDHHGDAGNLINLATMWHAVEDKPRPRFVNDRKVTNDRRVDESKLLYQREV